MTSDFTYYLDQFVTFYKKSLIHRFFIGGILGGLLWGASFIFSLISRQVLATDTFLETLLNDIPGIGFIFGLLITFEIWGLIPRPTITNEEEVSSEGSIGNPERENELKVEEKT